MPELIAFDLTAGPGFVDSLRAAWERGDAVLPLDRRLPAAARIDLARRLGAARILADDGSSTTLPDPIPVAGGDALIVATSGSTGVPKGVVLTHDAIAASAGATSRRLGVEPDDHWLACLPLSHVGGLSVVTRALSTGTRLTVLPGFDAAAVDASPATLVSLVATALGRIEPARWRKIVLGGGRPPADRPDNTVTTYGMTETGSGIVYDGRPLDGVDVEVRDGEIHVRGPMLLRCYRDGTEPFDADGWFATGDVGEITGDARLIVHGRRGDLIITGGENVWPEPVEAILRGVPGVADVAIVGRPDPEWGERVTAVVVPSGRDAPALAALRDAVKIHLPSYCAPRSVEFVARIPRTALGKIKRSTLLDPIN